MYNIETKRNPIAGTHRESLLLNATSESERETMNACEEGATKAVNDVIQTCERRRKESYTRGSKAKMLGELR